MVEGTTATDLVLTVDEMLREKGVVSKFVEFYGDGLDNLPLADRATIANMAPEYGATCGFFPVDKETLKYLDAHRPRQGPHRPGRGLPAKTACGATPELQAGLYRHAQPRHGRPSCRRSRARSARRTTSRWMTARNSRPMSKASAKARWSATDETRWLGEGGAPEPRAQGNERHHEHAFVETERAITSCMTARW